MRGIIYAGCLPMFSPYDGKLKKNARALRGNMTPQERRLWYEFLRSYPVKFYRQRIVGQYIVDFYCPRAALVVELDGSQHFELSEAERDMRRDAELAALGLLVLRFSNEELNRNFSAVCGEIDRQVRALARGRE